MLELRCSILITITYIHLGLLGHDQSFLRNCLFAFEAKHETENLGNGRQKKKVSFTLIPFKRNEYIILLAFIGWYEKLLGPNDSFLG